MCRCVLLMSLPVIFASSSSADLFVSPDGSLGYSNIQDAINDAPVRQLTKIVVLPGIYRETLVISTGQYIHLTSTNPPSEATRAATVVDAESAGRVITVLSDMGFNGLLTTCRIEGVTLRNGRADSAAGILGANQYLSPKSAVHLYFCCISNCHATGYSSAGGAAAYITGEIISNTICFCSSSNTAAGGISRSSGTIAGNTFYCNYGQNGGALSQCDGSLLGNIISNNGAALNGGGIYTCRSPLVLSNVIVGNLAGSSGGAVYDYAADNEGVLLGNTVSGNTAQRDGGAFYRLNGASFLNNYVCGNAAGRYGGAFADDEADQTDRLTFINNLICDNVASNSGGAFRYFQLCYFLHNTIAGNVGVGGNDTFDTCGHFRVFNSIVDASTHELPDNSVILNCCLPEHSAPPPTCLTNDPLFADAGMGDYHLTASSPCIDAGAKGHSFTLMFYADLDSRLRNDGPPDIGCYEHNAPADTDGDLLEDGDEATYSCSAMVWDSNGDGYPDGVSVLRGQPPLEDLTNVVFQATPATPPQAIYDRAVPGDTVRLAAGVYTGYFVPHTCVSLAGATNGAGDSLTVFDGEGVRPCMILARPYMNYEPATPPVFADLVFSNGFSVFGGGIMGYNPACDPSLLRCRFTHNRATYGGGMALADTDGLRRGGFGHVTECVFEHNSATGNGGAGMDLHAETIAACRFHGNSASNGGALYSAGGVITRCHFASNSATNDGGALARHADTVRNSLFIENHAGNRGGALFDTYLHEDEDVICNNTFVLNSALAAGGAVCLDGSILESEFDNNILWSNAAPTAAQFSAPVDYTALFANVLMDWPTTENGNTAAMPLFRDWAGGDFRVRSNDTVAVNTGIIYVDDILTQLDYDGMPRVAAPTVDRGCFEHAGDTFDFANASGRFVIVFAPSTTPTMAGSDEGGLPAHMRRGVNTPEGLAIENLMFPLLPKYDQYPLRDVAVLNNGVILLKQGDVQLPLYARLPHPLSLPWQSMAQVIGEDAYRAIAVAPVAGVYDGFMVVLDDLGRTNDLPGVGYVNDWSIWSELDEFPYIDLFDPRISIAKMTSEDNGSSALFGDFDGEALALAVHRRATPSPNAAAPRIPGVELYTQTLIPPEDDLDSGVAPTHSPDYGQMWYIDDDDDTLNAYDFYNGVIVAQYDLPEHADRWHLGSFPGGVVCAPYGRGDIFTLFYDAETRVGHARTAALQGDWISNSFDMPVVGISSAALREAIPEPALAALMYLGGGGLLAAVYSRHRMQDG